MYLSEFTKNFSKCDIYSYNLNKALIDYKLSGHDSAIRYDCERDTARNFVKNYDPSACY